MAAVANRWAGRWGGREGVAAPPTTTQPAPSRMYHCAPAPLDMHGSDMDGAARPWRLSRGDPRGRGDRGARSSGDRGARSSGDECTDGAAAPAEAARALPTAGGGAAWAAAVAEAEKEKEAESRGLVSSEGSRDDAVASRLSSGELSPDLLQTLMRMQDTHEAARERRRVRHTGSGGDVIGDVGSSGDTGSSADTPAAFPPPPRTLASPPRTLACNPAPHRLQPRAPSPAPPRTIACNPAHHRLQPRAPSPAPSRKPHAICLHPACSPTPQA